MPLSYIIFTVLKIKYFLFIIYYCCIYTYIHNHSYSGVLKVNKFTVLKNVINYCNLINCSKTLCHQWFLHQTSQLLSRTPWGHLPQVL
jgi:hypothetical protein